MSPLLSLFNKRDSEPPVIVHGTPLSRTGRLRSLFASMTFIGRHPKRHILAGHVSLFGVLSILALFAFLALHTSITVACFAPVVLMGLGVTGIPIVLAISRRASMSLPPSDAIILGVALGIPLSSLGYSLAAMALGISTAIVLLCILVGALGIQTWLSFRHYHSYWGPDSDKSKCRLIVLFSALAAIALSLPYISFGRVNGSGLTLSELQKTDLLHHLTTFVQLSQTIPPPNPYFADISLYYYWLSHVPASLIYHVLHGVVSSRDVLIATSFLYTILFIAILCVTLGRYKFQRNTIIILMVLALFANGYNDLFSLASWIVRALPQESPLTQLLVRWLLTDDWGGGYTGYSHGWFRSFLVEPQTVYASILLLSALYIFQPTTFRWDRSLGILLGAVYLSLIMPTDTFIFVVATSSLFLCFCISLLRTRLASPPFSAIIATVLCILALAFLMIALQMVTLSGPSLIVRPYYTMILLFPLVLFIDYGPLALLGPLGIVLALSGMDRRRFVLSFPMSLILVSLAFMFFVQYPDVGTQVFRKAGLILRTPLLLFAGVAIDQLPRRVSFPALTRGALVAAITLAIPTHMIDILKISSLLKHQPSFQLHPADLSAYAWIAERTPMSAIVQELPGAVSGVPALGERRSALGDWVHAENYQVGTARVRDRHREIYSILFLGTDMQDAIAVMRKYNIAYLYLGTDARRLMSKQAYGKFDGAQQSFEKISLHNDVVLYRLR